MLSLQFGELPTFRGVIGKLVVGEDGPWNNVRSHIQPPFFSNMITLRFSARIYARLFSLKFWIAEKQISLVRRHAIC